MNKLLFLGILFILFSCSQKQFSFRTKLKADKPVVAKSKKECEQKKNVYTEDLALVSPSDPVDTSSSINSNNNGGPKALQQDEVTASEKRSVIPFKLEHLSPERSAPVKPESKPLQPKSGGDILGFISLISGILGLVALLSLIFITSNMLGVIMLFSAPLLGTLALVLGITSVSGGSGKNFGWAGIVLGGMILLITLVMVLVAYLFIQSSLTTGL